MAFQSDNFKTNIVASHLGLTLLRHNCHLANATVSGKPLCVILIMIIMMTMMMMRRRRKIMVIKCSGGRVDINQPEDNRACFDHLLRTIYRTGCTWYKSCRKWKWRKRDYDRDNATMLTCRLHTWSKQRGKHCRWFEPLRFQCPFHICHTYPCASERISWRWVRYIIRLSEWVMEMILMMVMLLSPCNPFRRRSCPPRSSKCQLSLPRTQSSAAGSPSLTSSRTHCYQQSSSSSSYICTNHKTAVLQKKVSWPARYGGEPIKKYTS